MSPSTIDSVTLIAGVQDVLGRVANDGNYVVIVCPTAEMAERLAKIVGSMVSENGKYVGKFSGRTAQLASCGKISVVCTDDDIFISDDEPFKVEFFGWTAKDDSEGMWKWQSKATV